jgi:transcriptional regulator with XRE-family HTH domain
MTTSVRRQELKNFLRAHREKLSPSDYGLSDYPRRRTPGLRRDEVAQLAQIGITTYTFLEQGRNLTVSANVLKKLAAVFRLNEQEKHLLFKLAKQDQHEPNQTNGSPVTALLPMFEIPDACALTVVNHRFDILSRNAAAKLVFDCRGYQPNVLERLVNDPALKTFYEDYDYHFRHVVAYSRWMYAKYAEDEDLTEFIHGLKASSAEFGKAWSSYEIFDHSAMKSSLRLNHPQLGRLEGSYVLLSVFGHPGFTLCVFSPISTPENDSVAKIVQGLERMRAEEGQLCQL